MVPAPLQNLTEMLPQGVFAIVPDGGVTYLNPAGCDALGITPAELAEGINLFDFIDEAHRAYLRRRLAVILAGAPGQLAEYRIRRRDGTPLPAMIHAARLRVAGEVIGLQGLLIDITHRE